MCPEPLRRNVNTTPRNTNGDLHRPVLRVRQSCSASQQEHWKKHTLEHRKSTLPGSLPRTVIHTRQTNDNTRRSTNSPEIEVLNTRNINENDSGRASPEIPVVLRTQSKTQDTRINENNIPRDSCKSQTSPASNTAYQLKELFINRKACKSHESRSSSRRIGKIHVETEQQTRLPEYFQLRKSVRINDVSELIKTKREKEHQLVDAILNGEESGFTVKVLSDRGRAVFTNRVFQKGDFVLEYVGKLLSLKDARNHERIYSNNHALGCFMFYFKYLCKPYCIDATEETCRLGRLINHSRSKPNLLPKIVSVNGHPRLVFVANRAIAVNEELLYDYGDRSPASLRAHPWLAT